MGTNPEFAPFEFVGDDGLVDGIDIAIAQEIAKDMGYQLVIESMEFDTLPASVVSGKIDFVIAGMTITEDRKRSLLFSEPYFEATQVILVNANSTIATVADLAGKVIGVQQGTTGDLLVSDPEIGAKEVQRFSKAIDAVMELLNGKVDAVVIDTMPALVFQINNPTLKIITGDFEIEQYGIAVKPDNIELMEKINATLLRIKEDGTYDAIIVKYNPVTEEVVTP